MTDRPRHIPHWLFALFMRIKEPRSTRLAFFCIYLILVLGGSSAFTGPPSSINDVLGAALTILWGVFFIVGGILGASSVLRGSWWVERVGLLCSGTGFAMYAVVITFLQIQLAGPYLMQLCLIVFALIILTLRWTQIRRYAYDPEG
jgi:phosphoglycerol transferase MdoB-like AlkP superfamily enzyme